MIDHRLLHFVLSCKTKRRYFELLSPLKQRMVTFSNHVSDPSLLPEPCSTRQRSILELTRRNHLHRLPRTQLLHHPQTNVPRLLSIQKPYRTAASERDQSRRPVSTVSQPRFGLIDSQVHSRGSVRSEGQKKDRTS